MSASGFIHRDLIALSAWASFDTLLQRLDITTEPNFWDGLVTLIPYQDYFLESQYHDLEEGCVPGETQTPNLRRSPQKSCDPKKQFFPRAHQLRLGAQTTASAESQLVIEIKRVELNINKILRPLFKRPSALSIRGHQR